MSKRVRILLHQVPRMLSGILREAAAEHPSIELIEGDAAERPSGDGPGVEVVLAVAPDPNQDAVARALLFAWQATRVALLTPAGRGLVIYDLSSRQVSVADLPAGELLDVICRSVGESTGR